MVLSALFYYLMLGFLITHELDAVQQKEWRILPALSTLGDRLGAQVFIWAHVPLFILIFSFGGADPNSYMALGLSGFAIIHIALHLKFRTHPKNGFQTRTSWALIQGAGFFGAVHILMRSWSGNLL